VWSSTFRRHQDVGREGASWSASARVPVGPKVYVPWAGICGIGYGLRQIVEVQARAGASVQEIVIRGGAARSDLVRQLRVDAAGKSVLATHAEARMM
jgi:ribulose kinase